MINYSENEKEFFRKLLLDFEIRLDGRAKIQIREHDIIKNVIPSCFSSIKLKYDQKEILFAAKGELVKSYTRGIDKLLNISIESMYKIDDMKTKKEIENYIETLMLNKIDTSHFKVNKEIDEYYWKIYIDIYIFDTVKLSLLQMLSFGVKSLLNQLKIPKLVLFKNELTNQIEFDLIEVYEDVSESEKELHIGNVLEIPNIFIFAVLNNSIFLDPTEEEFSVASSIVIISIFQDKIQMVQSIGSAIEVQKIVEIEEVVKTI
jgi:exosome complex RNA-binding protein Rrp42 (RNase PH superfamily)